MSPELAQNYTTEKCYSFSDVEQVEQYLYVMQDIDTEEQSITVDILFSDMGLEYDRWYSADELRDFIIAIQANFDIE